MRCFDHNTDNEKTYNLIKFFNAIQYIVPCKRLSKLINEYIVEYPIQYAVSTSEGRIRWLVDLNSFICRNTGRRPDTVEGVCKSYDPDQINKTRWGNSVWYFIHYTALRQDSKISRLQQEAYRDFIYSLTSLLPCRMCREHLKQHLKESPIENYISSNTSLFSWTVDLHNRVNISLNKRVYSLQEAMELY